MVALQNIKTYLLLSLVILTTGCSGFETINSGSFSSNQCTPNKLLSNVALQEDGKISQNSQLITSKFSGKLAKASGDDTVLEAGKELVFFVDNDCLQANSGKWSGKVAQSKKAHKGLSIQAYSKKLDDSISLGQLKNEINDDACIAAVEPQMIFTASATPNDTRYNEQAFHPDIKSSQGWDIFYDSVNGIKSDEEVIIAVVDTGVDYNHPDLENQMWDDGNGNTGYDFVNGDDDPLDDNLHGTHVAGLSAGESNNNLGIAGIMGKNAKVMAVKVLDANGSGSLASVANGIRYAADNGAHIINLSLGANGASPALDDALKYAVGEGSFVVVAAGNDGKQITAGDFTSPAGYTKDISGAISVGATVSGSNGQLAGFSNYSNSYVEIAAPGASGILSTFPNNAYEAIQGTSMASPIVAGAAGLTFGLFASRNLALAPAALEEVLLEGSVARSNLGNRIKDNNHLDLLNLAQTSDAATENLIFIEQPRSLTKLIGTTITLTSAVNNELFVTYHWEKDGVIISGETGPELSIVAASDADNGSYRVVATKFGQELESQTANLNMVASCN